MRRPIAWLDRAIFPAFREAKESTMDRLEAASLLPTPSRPPLALRARGGDHAREEFCVGAQFALSGDSGRTAGLRACSKSSSGGVAPFSPQAGSMSFPFSPQAGSMSFPFSPQAGRRWRIAPDEGQALRLIRVLPTVRIRPRAKGAPHPAFGHPLPARRGEGRRKVPAKGRRSARELRSAHATSGILNRLQEVVEKRSS